MFDLSEYDQIFGDTKTDEKEKKEYTEVEDGTYVVSIERLEWKESKKGTRYLSWGLKIKQGPNTGQFLWKMSFLTNPVSIKILKEDIFFTGYTPEKLSEINLELLLDIKLEVKKVTKGEFSNIYFQKLLTEETETDIDMPF